MRPFRPKIQLIIKGTPELKVEFLMGFPLILVNLPDLPLHNHALNYSPVCHYFYVSPSCGY